MEFLQRDSTGARRVRILSWSHLSSGYLNSEGLLKIVRAFQFLRALARIELDIQGGKTPDYSWVAQR